MKKLVLIIMSALLVFSIADVDAKRKKKKKKSGYKVVEVTDGGSIAGKALLAGSTVPADEILTLNAEQSLCGDTLPRLKYVINGDKGIKNVVVYLDGIKEGKAAPSDPVVIDNIMCAFEPHVSVGISGKDKTAIIKNSDPVFHNTHSYISGRTVFNIGLPDKGMEIEKPMKRAGILEVKCDSHPWMLGYVFFSDHPYKVVTDESGSFSIGDIPAGSYKVKAWHEALGTIELGEVTVEAGKTDSLNAEFK